MCCISEAVHELSHQCWIKAVSHHPWKPYPFSPWVLGWAVTEPRACEEPVSVRTHITLYPCLSLLEHVGSLVISVVVGRLML